MIENEALSQMMEKPDDRELMTGCIIGLRRFAQELEVCQGIAVAGKIAELHNLIHEITDFWDLDGTLFPAPCESVE